MDPVPELVLELDIPPTPEYVAIARLAVASLAATRQLLDERVDDLKLAVSEACTNAIEASVTQPDSGPVRIAVFEAADRIEVHVTDRGGGFDPAAVPGHPPVTDPERLNYERGLGIPLMRNLVDEIEFVFSAEGTTVRMALFGGTDDSESG